jgi:two-component system, chemotaxis family, response regulator Rcp1
LSVAARPKVVEVLLVEDNPGDSRLTLEAIRDCSVETNLKVVRDGVEAMAFLRKEGVYSDAPRPALILLDLNLPKKSGREVLEEVKNDPDLRRIPVVVFSTSESEDDVLTAYGLHANCYIAKPKDMSQLIAVVRCIEEFWLTRVRLPAD